MGPLNRTATGDVSHGSHHYYISAFLCYNSVVSMVGTLLRRAPSHLEL